MTWTHHHLHRHNEVSVRKATTGDTLSSDMSGTIAVGQAAQGYCRSCSPQRQVIALPASEPNLKRCSANPWDCSPLSVQLIRCPLQLSRRDHIFHSDRVDHDSIPALAATPSPSQGALRPEEKERATSDVQTCE
jgi:hypothetical protein